MLSEFEMCPELWCVFPYIGPGFEPMWAFGCVRFRRELMCRLPHVVPRSPWRRLDSDMKHMLMTADPPVAFHEHKGLVTHHHVYDGRCTCGGEHT